MTNKTITILITLTGLTIGACKTRDRQLSSQQNLDITEEDRLAELSNEDEAAPVSKDRVTLKAPKKKKLEIVHPKKADAWTTQRAIMVSEQPTTTQVESCIEQVEAASRRATHFRMLDEAALSLEGTVKKDLPVFHWCFYQLAADLDIKLEKEIGITLADKSEVFLSRTKTMWVLARVLDQVSVPKKSTYMKYLRARYIEISQSHFGRSVEVIDPKTLLISAGKAGKPAREYQDP